MTSFAERGALMCAGACVIGITCGTLFPLEPEGLVLTTLFTMLWTCGVAWVGRVK